MELEALKGQKRERAIVMPRQIAMYLMRAETDVSLLRIGAELGGRDHSTVLHACDKIDREMQENEELRRELAAVREMIYAGLTGSGRRQRRASTGARAEASQASPGRSGAGPVRGSRWTSGTRSGTTGGPAGTLPRNRRAAPGSTAGPWPRACPRHVGSPATRPHAPTAGQPSTASTS